MGKYYQQTITRTILWGLILIIVVAFVLIWVIYGKEAAVTGFSCMLSGLLPVAAVLIVFQFLEYFLKKYRQSEENQNPSPALRDSEQSNEDTSGGEG